MNPERSFQMLDTDRSFQILYYHYVDTRVGFGDGDKKFGWNKIDFSSGWPVV